MDLQPIRFISEPIEVGLAGQPTLRKRPGCPEQFVWRGDTYRIVERLSEWHDYRRRGRMASNMRPEHATRAERKGSWGVGRDYYRVRTHSGRFFDLYYDRAPKNARERMGSWFLHRELEPDSDGAGGPAGADRGHEGPTRDG